VTDVRASPNPGAQARPRPNPGPRAHPRPSPGPAARPRPKPSPKTAAAISLQGIGKSYNKTVHGGDFLLKKLVRPGSWFSQPADDPLWALRDIDLTVARGETIGVIGRNGSGKTTLLRMLSGVSAPSTGHLRVVGSIAPLIGIGVGFHAELTGRENVMVNGRLLGMSDRELKRKFDDIVAFSEIEEFIDTPVKFYSSGMFLRLGFSVAIHTQPDVLLVDEILAVGDLAFQLKCLERMREIQESGTTIVIVTHNLPSLDRMASRAILLSRGRKMFDGPTEDALAAYHRIMEDETSSRNTSAGSILSMQQGSELVFTGGSRVSVDLLTDDGRASTSFRTDDQMRVRITAEFDDEVTDPIVGIMVAPAGGQFPAYATHSFPGAHRAAYGPERPFVADVELALPLLSGAYTVRASVTDEAGKATLGESRAETFYVSSTGRPGIGLVDMQARIIVDDQLLEDRSDYRLRSGTGAG
jgi:ABC-2 type transport system ATP-binding protein